MIYTGWPNVYTANKSPSVRAPTVYEFTHIL